MRIKRFLFFLLTGEPRTEIDFTPPFKRLSLPEELVRYMGPEISKMDLNTYGNYNHT